MSTCASAPAVAFEPTLVRASRYDRTLPLVFLLFLATAWLVAGRAFTFTNDEGIYLEGARAIVEGKVLYKDHFAFTGPGTYWFLAACFQLFGFTIAAARIPFVIDMAVTATFAFWFGRRFISTGGGIFTALVCFIVQIANPGMQNTNHRWDSAALACIAIALACRRRPSRWAPFFSGFCIAAAAWCSPPVLFVGAILAIWFWRKQALPVFLGGGTLCTALSVATLAATGSLPYLIPGLRWAGENYTESNRVPYGYLNGGIANIYAGGDALYAVIATIALVAILAPAICPILNLLGAREILRGPAEVGLVTICSVALVASTYPRVDTGHLTNVLAPAIAVSAWLSSRWRFGKYLAAVASFSAMLLLLYTVQARIVSERRDTRSGVVFGQARELDDIVYAQSAIPAGASLFVYPYLPMMYFVTGGVNPTPYSFLQPGMMTERDEHRVLERLRQNPPEYVVFLLISSEELLRIWPNSDLRRLRMPDLEGWVQSNYKPDLSGKSINTYRVFRRAVLTQ